MVNNIELWIENLIDQVDARIHLEVVPTPRGWAAKIVEDGYILLDSEGEAFMIKEGSSVEEALEKLNRFCLKDLKEIAAKESQNEY